MTGAELSEEEIRAGAAMIAVLRPLDGDTRMNALVIACKAVIEPELRARLLDGPTTVRLPRMSTFEERRARFLDSKTDLNAPHELIGMVDDEYQAKYDRRGLILTLDATRAALDRAGRFLDLYLTGDEDFNEASVRAEISAIQKAVPRDR